MHAGQLGEQDSFPFIFSLSLDSDKILMWREQLLSLKDCSEAKKSITFSSFPRQGNRTPCPMSLLRWRAIWGRWGSRMAAVKLVWPLNCHLSTSFLLSGLQGWFAASPGFFFSRNLTNPGIKEELCVRKKLPPLHIPMTHHLLERRYLLSHK